MSSNHRPVCGPSGLTGVLLLAFLLLAGCATPPVSNGEVDPPRIRAETRTDGAVRVSAVVLSRAETSNEFPLPLVAKGIQPVWLEVENREKRDYYLMLLSVDPDYFTPSEIAWSLWAQDSRSVEEMTDILLEKHVPLIIPAESTVSGYVYTRTDPGAKAFAVELFSEEDALLFEFIQAVPGFQADFMRVDFDRLYQEKGFRELDLDRLRGYLERLPCCVLGGDRKTPGDPLNLVMVGEGRHVFATLVRMGWDLTETAHGIAKWQTILSSLFGLTYRTSPISPLYLFERPQDIGFQKIRTNVDERNHLRLWLAPVMLQGKHVWVGQISRDIGVKFSSKTLVTHKIDPYVDEARSYVALDLARSQALSAVGYVTGVGASYRPTARTNYTDDAYYTDGLRVVLILEEERRSLDEIEFLSWEEVKPRKRMPVEPGR